MAILVVNLDELSITFHEVCFNREKVKRASARLNTAHSAKEYKILFRSVLFRYFRAKIVPNSDWGLTLIANEKAKPMSWSNPVPPEVNSQFTQLPASALPA